MAIQYEILSDGTLLPLSGGGGSAVSPDITDLTSRVATVETAANSNSVLIAGHEIRITDLEALIGTGDISDEELAGYVRAAISRGQIGATYWPTSGGLNIYVRTDGNNANDGLSDSASGAVLNWTGVFEVLRKVNVKDAAVIVNFGAGTFAGEDIIGEQISGSGTKYLHIRGVAGETFFSLAFTVRNLRVNIYDIEFQSSLQVYDGATVYSTDCVFNTHATSRHNSSLILTNAVFKGNATNPNNAVYVYQGGNCHITTKITFSGVFTNCLSAGTGGAIDFRNTGNIPIELIDVSFADVYGYGFIHAGGRTGGGEINFHGIPVITGTATGRKYLLETGGKITGISKAELDALPIGDTDGVITGYSAITHSGTYISGGDSTASDYLLADGTDAFAPVITAQSRGQVGNAIDIAAGTHIDDYIYSGNYYSIANNIPEGWPDNDGGWLIVYKNVRPNATIRIIQFVMRLSSLDPYTTIYARKKDSATADWTPWRKIDQALTQNVTGLTEDLELLMDDVDALQGEATAKWVTLNTVESSVNALVPRVTTAENRITALEAGGGTGTVDLSGVVPINRIITTTAPLQGGGDLSGDLTLSVARADGSDPGVVYTFGADYFGPYGFLKDEIGWDKEDVPTAGVMNSLTDKVVDLYATVSTIESDINTVETNIDSQVIRLTTAEGNISDHETRIVSLEESEGTGTQIPTDLIERLETLESDVQAIGEDVSAALSVVIGGDTSNVLRDTIIPIVEEKIAELEISADLSSVVPITRTITTTSPLTGGGDLSSNRTLAISDATTSAKGAVQLATTTEATTGTDTTKAVTPAGLAAHVTAKTSTLATESEVNALTTRVNDAEVDITSQEMRITNLEENGVTVDLTSIETRLDNAETDIVTIGVGINETLDLMIGGDTAGILRDTVIPIVDERLAEWGDGGSIDLSPVINRVSILESTSSDHTDSIISLEDSLTLTNTNVTSITTRVETAENSIIEQNTKISTLDEEVQAFVEEVEEALDVLIGGDTAGVLRDTVISIIDERLGDIQAALAAFLRR